MVKKKISSSIKNALRRKSRTSSQTSASSSDRQANNTTNTILNEGESISDTDSSHAAQHNIVSGSIRTVGSSMRSSSTGGMSVLSGDTNNNNVKGATQQQPDVRSSTVSSTVRTTTVSTVSSSTLTEKQSNLPSSPPPPRESLTPPLNNDNNNNKDSNSISPRNSGKSGEESVPQQIITLEGPEIDTAYELIPHLEIIDLPRGGVSIETQAVGHVQFGIPPETIKDSMKLGIAVPSVYIVPVDRFCREFGPALGVNLAEFEFPAYFNFFVQRKRCTLIVDSVDAERNIRRVFSETLLGPAQFRRGEDPLKYEKEGTCCVCIVFKFYMCLYMFFGQVFTATHKISHNTFTIIIII